MPEILSPDIPKTESLSHVRSMFENDRASHSLGMQITELQEGRACGRFLIKPEMCNGHGSVQGGYLFAFADSLFAGACNAAGDTAVAAHVGIHYIAPAFEGEVVEGVAIEKQKWGRNGITDVTLTVNGKVVAEFRGTSRIIKPMKA